MPTTRQELLLGAEDRDVRLAVDLHGGQVEAGRCAGRRRSGSGTQTKLRPSTSTIRAPAPGLPSEAESTSSSSLPGQPPCRMGMRLCREAPPGSPLRSSAADAPSAVVAARCEPLPWQAGARASPGARPRAATSASAREVDPRQGVRRVPVEQDRRGAARPAGRPCSDASRAAARTAPRCRAKAYRGHPAPALALAGQGLPGGDVEQQQVQGAAPAAGLAGEPAAHPGLRAAVVDDDALAGAQGAPQSRVVGERGRAGGRPRTAGGGGIRASQRSRVSWESIRRPRTARRISVDLPLPGRPETTTRSPAAKARPCGLRPARSAQVADDGCRARVRTPRGPGPPGCAGTAPRPRSSRTPWSCCTVIVLPRCRVTQHPCPSSVKRW